MATIEKLIEEMADDMGATPLRAKDDAVNYAETDGETLFYNAGFMRSIEVAAGEDGLRFVVAHEMGHQLYGMGHGGHEAEFMADEFAARSLARVGGDLGSITSVFNLLNSPSSDSHPASSSRHARAKDAYQIEREYVDADSEAIAKPKTAVARDLAI